MNLSWHSIDMLPDMSEGPAVSARSADDTKRVGELLTTLKGLGMDLKYASILERLWSDLIGNPKASPYDEQAISVAQAPGDTITSIAAKTCSEWISAYGIGRELDVWGELQPLVEAWNADSTESIALPGDALGARLRAIPGLTIGDLVRWASYITCAVSAGAKPSDRVRDAVLDSVPPRGVAATAGGGELTALQTHSTAIDALRALGATLDAMPAPGVPKAGDEAIARSIMAQLGLQSL